MPESENDNLYVDGNGDVKTAIYSWEKPEKTADSSEASQSPEQASETRPEQLNPATQQLIAERLQGVNDLLTKLGMTAAQPALSSERQAAFMGMENIFDHQISELRRRLVKGEVDDQEIASLAESIKQQIELGKSEVYQAKEAKANEDQRHSAEVAGRTVVAGYEARKAAEAAQGIVQVNREQVVPPPTQAQPTPEATKTVPEISKGERELGRKYGQVANLAQELLNSSAYRVMNDDPRVIELKETIKHYQDLSQHQLDGSGRKPSLFGGMREVDGTIQKLRDAIFAQQQQKTPTGGKETKKRLEKIAKSDNKYKKFI